MKKLLLFICVVFIAEYGCAQTQLWGMTSGGGPSGSGVIFHTDGSGNNEYTELTPLLEEGKQPAYTNLIQATDGKLYGMTELGGANNKGVIFQFDPVTGTHLNLFDFDGTVNGSRPEGSLLQASDGKLYGMTYFGGTHNFGILFQFDPVSLVFTKKLDFDSATNGSYPSSTLIQASDGMLYGMTSSGGNYNRGTIFRFDPVNSVLSQLLVFGGPFVNGRNPYGSLMQASDGMLYGMTLIDNFSQNGVLFQFNPINSSYVVKFNFDGAANGRLPFGDLVQATDGNLYGMTQVGGVNNAGVLFRFNITNSTFTNLLAFNGTSQGGNPKGSLIQATDGKLYGMTFQGGSSGYGILFRFDYLTLTLNDLIDFGNLSNGAYPGGSLLQASDGMMYGLNTRGLFQMNPSTLLLNFEFHFDGLSYGTQLAASFLQASDGLLYAIAQAGGINYEGTIFQFDPGTSIITKKFELNNTLNGITPSGSLIQASDGMFYGLAYEGGINDLGVLYQFDPVTSTYSDRFNFDGATHGAHPVGALMQASNGKLYGMTYNGGATGWGVLFQFDPITSSMTNLFDFDDFLHGAYPSGSVIQATNGMLYGLTYQGGTNNHGTLFQYDLTTSTFTKRLDFGTGSDGKDPKGSLIQASNGLLYGLCYQGGIFNYGTIFQFDPVTLSYSNDYNFLGTAQGQNPSGTLLQASDGLFYGMTTSGGGGGGTIFQFDPVNSIYTVKHGFNGADGGSPLYTALIEIGSFVWPGDANEDAVADNNDILAIGIANGATGSSRANATINWVGQNATNWGQTFANGTNYKYADCDGSGIIQPADTIAVIQNFGLIHAMRLGGTPVYNATLPDLKIILGQDTIPTSSQGTMSVSLGSPSNQVSNLYGLAFTLNFDPTEIDATSFRMNENGSWMGIQGTDLMGVVMNSGAGTASVEIAITRLNHTDTSGFGNIANLSFLTASTLTGTGNYQTVNFTISNVTAISANEIPQTLNMVNDSVVIVDSVLFSGIVSNEITHEFSIYPNPSSGIFTLKSGIINGEIAVTNLLGEVVFQSMFNNPNATIDLSSQANGIYFVNVKSENGSFTQKIILQK